MACRSCVLRRRLAARTVSQSDGTPAIGATWSRCSVIFQQLRQFRKISKKKPEWKAELQEPGVSGVSPPQRARPGLLLRPLLFTLGFSSCSFGAAAIWQYESLKSRVRGHFDQLRGDWLEKLRPQKRGGFRKEINLWWNSLSEGQRCVSGIIALNVAVFCCWRVPSLQRRMIKYFTSDPASKTLCLPMFLSTFSHASFLHLSTNMFVLWSFSSSTVSLLGPEQFLAVYLSAGVISSFASYLSKVTLGRFGPSLGASGAIMSVLAVICTKLPESELSIIFLPMFTFTAANALKAVVAMDTAGLLLGWRLLDHAAHLGGAAFGIWYILWGHELIWKNREPLVRLWHQLRTGGGR